MGGKRWENEEKIKRKGKEREREMGKGDEKVEGQMTKEKEQHRANVGEQRKKGERGNSKIRIGYICDCHK
jgi:hypothetical protein